MRVPSTFALVTHRNPKDSVPIPLDVLLLEDNPTDAERVLDALRAAGFDATAQRVDSEPDFRQRLQTGERLPDLILASYTLPQLDGPRALRIAREAAVEIPFIFVSGRVGEDAAAEAIKQGAADYVLKDRLARLGPAVRDALREATEGTAHQKMEAEHKRLITAVAYVAEAVFITDVAGRIEYVNPAFEKITGYISAEVIGQNPRILQSGEQDAAYYHEMWDTLTRGQVWHGALVNRKRDGTPYQTEQTISPVLDASGQIVNYVAVQHDVTQRARAEEALAAREKYFRALIEHSADGVALVNAEGIIVYTVPSTLRLLGYREEEFVGRNLFGLIHPEDQAMTAGVFAALLEEPGRIKSATCRVLHHDGAWRWIETTGTNLLQEPGVTAIVANLRDVTERKQAAEALRESEERLRMGLNTVNIAVFSQDMDLRYIWMHQPQLGYGADVVGHTDDELLPPEAAKQITEIKRRVLASGLRERAEVSVSVDGQTFIYDLAAEPLRDTGGAIIGLTGATLDITERKRSEAAEHEQRTLAEALLDTAEALNSTLNFDEVLERILTNVQRVVPHDTATLMLVENGIGRVVGGRGFASEAAQAILKIRLPVNELPNLRRAMQSGEPEITADTRTQPDWMSFPETEWIRSNIGAPIRRNEQVIGLLNLDSATPHHFTNAHKERLRAFATQAGVAMENARLLNETRQQLGELAALNSVSTALRGAQLLDQMLPILLDETLAVLHASAGAIRLYDPQRDELQAVLGRGWFTQVSAPLKPGQGIAGNVFSSGKAHNSRDLRADPQSSPQVLPNVPAGWSGACVPVRSAEAIVGVLFVAVELPRELSASEVRLLTTVSEMAGAAIQRMSLHEQTTRHVQRLMILQTIERTISSSFDVRLTLNVLLDQLITQLGIDAADVMLRTPATHMLEVTVARGYAGNRPQPLRLGEGLAGKAALERKIMVSQSDEQKTSTMPPAQPLSNDAFAVQVAIPLVAKAEVKGVLRIFQRAAFSPDREWLEFMEMLAGQVAIAIDNSQLFAGAQRSNLELALAYDTTLEGWSRALDLRDKETEGHTQRVTELALQLARRMGLSDAELVHMRRGGLLHDIGKMGVPDSILLKPGPLTAAEWVIMKQHPEYANELLSPIAFLRSALDIPYCHHEKWDGSGYPRGLKGDEIPLAARIFAIVDVWDALRSDRPYRAAWSEAKARAHIQALAGTHFEPRVVTSLLSMV